MQNRHHSRLFGERDVSTPERIDQSESLRDSPCTGGQNILGTLLCCSRHQDIDLHSALHHANTGTDMEESA